MINLLFIIIRIRAGQDKKLILNKITTENCYNLTISPQKCMMYWYSVYVKVSLCCTVLYHIVNYRNLVLIIVFLFQLCRNLNMLLKKDSSVTLRFFGNHLKYTSIDQNSHSSIFALVDRGYASRPPHSFLASGRTPHPPLSPSVVWCAKPFLRLFWSEWASR